MTIHSIVLIIAAAATAASLYVILRLFPKYKIVNLHALTANYITASACSFIAGSSGNSFTFSAAGNFVLPALLIGALFISVFYTAAKSTQICGVSVTSIAGKMSMIIPVAFAVIHFNDSLPAIKIIGMVTALAAVYFSAPQDSKSSHNAWLLPVLVFVGSGLVDTSVKIAQHYFITDENEPLFISMLFGSAACIGIILTVTDLIRNKSVLTLKSIMGGVILGICNYFSLYFLVKCLAVDGMESSLVFSMVNLLVIAFSAVAALLFFKEKTNAKQITGLILALFAVILLYIAA